MHLSCRFCSVILKDLKSLFVDFDFGLRLHAEVCHRSEDLRSRNSQLRETLCITTVLSRMIATLIKENRGFLSSQFPKHFSFSKLKHEYLIFLVQQNTACSTSEIIESTINWR